MTEEKGHLVLVVERAISVPSKSSTEESDPFVVIETEETKQKTVTIKGNADPEWKQVLDMGLVSLKENFQISLFNDLSDSRKLTLSGRPPPTCELIGSTNITVLELIKRPEIFLLLQKKNGNPVVKKSRNAICQIVISIDSAHFPVFWKQPETRNYEGYPKHVVMITRGTRGDVQPFLALARGIAENLGWMVTIITELKFKQLIKSNSKVNRGCIRFRPSGGDTEHNIVQPQNLWALWSKSDVMQAAILARTEAEFFPSEPVVFHWVENLKPDLLVFGFTLISLVMMVSEKFNIPILGFILQPTSIPSEELQSVVPITKSTSGIIPKIQSFLKNLIDNNPFEENLYQLRKKHGLNENFDNQSWMEAKKQEVPFIIPINEHCFGTKPKDWHEDCILTNFIFLKTLVIPLEDRIKKFIEESKLAGEPLVVMAFSSMPVPRIKILEIATSLIINCKSKPRVIVLIGPQNIQNEVQKPKNWQEIEEMSDNLKKEGKLIETLNAPFGTLFPKMDCIIIHGGLGTTAEALRAGVPIIVTGLLLMDQRFWAQRVFELGLGPEPVHFDDFSIVAVSYVNQLLEPGNTYLEKAREISNIIGTEDGVMENVEVFEKLFKKAKVINYGKVVVDEKQKEVPTVYENEILTPLRIPKMESLTPPGEKQTETTSNFEELIPPLEVPQIQVHLVGENNVVIEPHHV